MRNIIIINDINNLMAPSNFSKYMRGIVTIYLDYSLELKQQNLSAIIDN